MKKIIFTLLILANSLLLAQTTLTGKIQDSRQRPIEEATVMLLENDTVIVNGAITNDLGYFSISPVEAGKYKIRVEHYNFAPQRLEGDEFVVKTNNAILNLGVFTFPEIPAAQYPEVVIIEFRNPVFEKSREQGITFDAKEIRNLGTREVRAVTATTPGVYSGDKGGELSVRGGRSAGTAYYIDGVKVRGKVNIPSSGKREIISGETPAEHGGDFTHHDATIEKAGTLTAGEVNDFGKWDLWKDIEQTDLKHYNKEWKLFPNNRYVLQLETQNSFPIANAKVYLETEKGENIWVTRTDNTGKAELWANLYATEKKGNLRIQVEYEGKTYKVDKITPFQKGINFLKIKASCADKPIIDIAFVVDATGSMDDEINYLKSELFDVIHRTKDSLSNADLRLGAVFYRDKGEEYVTKFSDFTANIEKTIQFIGDNTAKGGGDMPEAVDEALKTALSDLNWRKEATSRLVFLILDAPPHNDSLTLSKMHTYIELAAEKGVRIVPIVCSGADKSTEYLMRAMALATNGTYLFLTDHSKVGGSHLKPTTDKFDVVYFNQLLCNTIVNFSRMNSCKNIDNETVKTDTASVTQIIASKTENAENPQVKVDSVATQSKSQVENKIEWKYYPNPTTGILTVEIKGNIAEFYVADLSGKILQRYKVTENEEVKVDLSEFPNGVYLLRYEYEKDKFMTGKLVLMH